MEKQKIAECTGADF